MHDVVIVGAGPAGGLAALILARAGADVLLLDRARFPREKLCGDTVNPGTVGLLRRHGLAQVLDGSLLIDGMIVTGASGVRVEGRYRAGVQGRAIARRDLDARIVAAAAAAGVRVEEGVLVSGARVGGTDGGPIVTGVTVKSAEGRRTDIQARVVIAADGRHSRVARGLALSWHPAAPRRWAVGAYFEQVQGLSTCGEMHVRAGRYMGVAPLAGGIANACIVTADRAALHDPEKLLLHAVKTDVMLADRFAAARPIGRAVCVGPLAVECDVPGTRGLLLAGDAAGFIDPMTGDGMRFALCGAELAATAALDALEHGWRDVHLRLRAARRRTFGRKRRFNRALRSLVGSAATLRLADHGASLAPALVRALIRYAGDLRAA